MTARVLYPAIVLLALLAPFEVVVWTVPVDHVARFSNLEIAGACVGLGWLLALLVERRLPRINRRLALPGLVFLLACIISALLAPGARLDALRFTGRVVAGFALFVIVADVVDSRERAVTLMKVMAISGVIVGGLAVLEYLGVQPVVAFLSLFKAHPTRVGGFLRASSSLMYATIAAMYLELTFPFLVAWQAASLTASPRPGSRMQFLALCLGVLVVLEGIILTFTRAGLIAIVAALAVMALVWSRRHGIDRAIRTMGLTGAGFGLLLALAILTSPMFKLRLVSENDSSWYRAGYQMQPIPTLMAGQTTTVEVELTNTGQRSWPADGRQLFALSYHWLSADGKAVIVFEGLRTPLPHEVQPGETVRLQAQLRAPSQSGTYRLAWDMVQEDTTWFSAKGSPASDILVQILPGIVTTASSEKQPFELEVDPAALSPDRLTLWRVAVKMFMDRPMLGIGPDNFRQLYGRYTSVRIWNRAIHANNMYLEMLADLGLGGSGIFLWLMISLGQALRAAFHRSWRDRFGLWVLGLIGSLTAFLVHGFVDYFLEFTSIYFTFWMIVALIAVAAGSDGGSYADRVRCDESTWTDDGSRLLYPAPVDSPVAGG